jgi:hypothetical protein
VVAGLGSTDAILVADDTQAIKKEKTRRSERVRRSAEVSCPAIVDLREPQPCVPVPESPPRWLEMFRSPR